MPLSGPNRLDSIERDPCIAFSLQRPTPSRRWSFSRASVATIRDEDSPAGYGLDYAGVTTVATDGGVVVREHEAQPRRRMPPDASVRIVPTCRDPLASTNREKVRLSAADVPWEFGVPASTTAVVSCVSLDVS